MGVNYGLNRVRFPAPLRVGGRCGPPRSWLGGGGRGRGQVVAAVTVESDGGDKPVCVAETVSRVYRLRKR